MSNRRDACGCASLQTLQVLRCRGQRPRPRLRSSRPTVRAWHVSKHFGTNQFYSPAKSQKASFYKPLWLHYYGEAERWPGSYDIAPVAERIPSRLWQPLDCTAAMFADVRPEIVGTSRSIRTDLLNKRSRIPLWLQIWRDS